MTQPTNISSCTAADLDSCASRTNRLSKNSTTALINPSALSSKPEWPAGLRGRGLSLLISESFWTNAGRPDPGRTQFRAPCISLLSDFRARTAPHLPGTYGRGSWHLPTLVLLCRVLRPRLAPPCLGILPQKRLQQISNLPLLYEHVLCYSAIYSAYRRRPMMSVVLVYFLLPLVISSWYVRCDYPRAFLNGQTPTCL